MYIFLGEFNNRPFFKRFNIDAKELSSECLWYFSTCPLSVYTGGVISYNGWYISHRLDTSSYTAACDMYCCYTTSSCPPFNENGKYASSKWITRTPGLPPLGGSGIAPVPSILQGASVDVLEYLTNQKQHPVRNSSDQMRSLALWMMLLRVSLPDGTIVSLPVYECDSVFDILVQIDTKYHKWRYYEIQLQLNERVLQKDEKLLLQDVVTGQMTSISSPGDILVAGLVADSFHTITSLKLHHCKSVVVIGGGPVGE